MYYEVTYEIRLLDPVVIEALLVVPTTITELMLIDSAPSYMVLTRFFVATPTVVVADKTNIINFTSNRTKKIIT